jgi:streptogramin lyase
MRFLVPFTALLFALAPMTVRAGPIVMDEASLGQTGRPAQVNLAPDGSLVVSDDVAGQIWRINPNTGAYTVYQGVSYEDMSSPVDAHADAAGNIWFADWTNETLGRIVVPTGSLTLWKLPGAVAAWGVAIDARGQVWVADAGGATLYRFKPGSGASGQLSCYTLPGGGISSYVLVEGSDLWLGDAVNGWILRVDLGTDGNPGAVKAWEIAHTLPEGMALDGSGRLWWADMGLNQLVRLSPLTDQVTGFAPPVAGSNPLAVQASGDRIWYTEGPTTGQSGIGTLGLLDPALAGGAPVAVSTGTASLTESPACGALSGKSGALAITNGALSWAPSLWSSAAEGNGWSVYRLPAGGKPYGVAMVGGSPWVADQGRRKLTRPSGAPVHSTYLPVVNRS